MDHLDDSRFDTVVGQDVVLTGTLKNTGSILINGRVQGDVISNESVVVGPEAMVEGPISAENVQVAGGVQGSITAANTLELLPNSHVKGDIKAGTLNIQPGAVFNGSSTMEIGEDVVVKEAVAEDETSYGEVEEEAVVEEEEDEPLDRIRKRKPKLELEDE